MTQSTLLRQCNDQCVSRVGKSELVVSLGTCSFEVCAGKVAEFPRLEWRSEHHRSLIVEHNNHTLGSSKQLQIGLSNIQIELKLYVQFWTDSTIFRKCGVREVPSLAQLNPTFNVSNFQHSVEHDFEIPPAEHAGEKLTALSPICLNTYFTARL